MKKVGIIMGSDSDLPIIRKATDMLSNLEIPFEVHVYSAHRTPDEARDFARNARANGFGVLIAAAGMQRIWQAPLPPIPHCPSSASPAKAACWTAWTLCFPLS